MIAIIAFILAIVVFLVMFLGGHVGDNHRQIEIIDEDTTPIND